MKLEVVDDRAEWVQVMGDMPPYLMDIHYLPEYYWGTARGMGWWPNLAFVRDGSNLAVMPFLVTQDNRLTTVHNFGGPLATSDHTGQELVLQLDQWAHEAGLMGEVTLCPFMGKRQRSMLRGDRHVRDAIWVDLGRPLDLRGTTRRCVEHATREGVTITTHHVPSRQELVPFQRIYWATMARVGAGDRWLYPPGFFYSLFEEMGNQVTLLQAHVPGHSDPEAGAILVHGYGTCYYHWAGSLNQFPRLGVSHLLVRKSIEWARTQGYLHFYLGGGLRPGDGLEVFKRGFSPLRERVYRYVVG